ncbi:pyrroline-5-carboxylate reductase [Coralliovum pocilloporae]|uniref:pyrroline-5-carboxylate reductase n=1 Tax=Coralliovum pocilloporae TaxID=3066369 RepID=UPI0033079289
MSQTQLSSSGASLSRSLPLVLIGAGKMGGAMLAGWLAGGLDGEQVTVVDPFLSSEMQSLCECHKVAVRQSVTGLSVTPSVLLVAVKPQMMADVLPELAALAGPDSVVVSIAAGTPIRQFEDIFGDQTAVVRVMPNTPAQVGRGISAVIGNDHFPDNMRATIDALLESIGSVQWLSSEEQMDAVTAVSGSGPAYVFLLAEELAKAGVAAGLPEDMARRLARETVSGAGELLRQSDLAAGTLRENVTSPGGTTAAALSVLMADDGFQPLLERAVAAAARRSRELAG